MSVHNAGSRRKDSRGKRAGRRRIPVYERLHDHGSDHDDRLLWLSIALVAGIDGGVLAGLLTAVAGGSKQAALAAGGVAALGTFGTVLTVIRYLHGPQA